MSGMDVIKIKDSLTIEDVLRQYGIETSRHKRIKCPLHHGDGLNFSYTDKRFKCWVCNESGDVIALAEKLLGLSFSEAIARLDVDFDLGLKKKPNKAERVDFEVNQKIAEACEKEKQKYKDYHRRLSSVHRNIFSYAIEHPEDKRAETIRKKLEEWLENNIEEVIQPWQT